MRAPYPNSAWVRNFFPFYQISCKIEEPRGKPRGFFDRKEFCLFLIRSLTPQQAAENALAIAVQAIYRLS
jgi:hypothetical protein